MSCPVCSGSLKVILVEPDNNYICVKIPEMSKSCSDDSCWDIITVTSDSITSEDIRVLYCYNISLSIITLQNNSLLNHFVGVDSIMDGSHLSLKVKDDKREYLTQMVQLTNNNDNNVALAFKSDDSDTLYYVTSTGIGKPLVIDSTIAPPYIFRPVIPTGKEMAG
ncbi:uncharacterized protein [Dysidea avara]|uniref:uncharacterized protein n=1 Tax=Dysidea avara TaxID=196820 RepID=UPI003325B424